MTRRRQSPNGSDELRPVAPELRVGHDILPVNTTKADVSLTSPKCFGDAERERRSLMRQRLAVSR